MFFTSSKPGSKFKGSGMEGRKERPVGGPAESVGVASVAQRVPQGPPPGRRDVGPLAIAPIPEKPRR